jgi:hypothetical protein
METAFGYKGKSKFCNRLSPGPCNKRLIARFPIAIEAAKRAQSVHDPGAMRTAAKDK